ncbi:MAG: TIGR03960 family B12-binding radical SAM protein [Ruminococcaceae bacterium]|nr:TIGR03960 family B12-binding radical SAM protein [Oscillospiraceae bacterium]
MKVAKPGRYTGGEYGQVVKDKAKVKARFAFCFPDTYEIGMSNLGVRILYTALNAHEDIWCERVYAPWTDMEAIMREKGLPLYALESGDELKAFDFVAFTLQYELCYTNVLNMLDLAGIPLLSKDRSESDPIVIGGGPCAYNAEPIADFFDVFSIGEGEEALPEITRLYIDMKEKGTYSRSAFLHEAAKLEGFYVPSLYDVTYNEDGTIEAFHPLYDDIPKTIRKRIIEDMDKAVYPQKIAMPFIETVHDRIMLEVYRGCIHGCRFCQAGMVYRPLREKSPQVLNDQAKCLYQNTGYSEISLTSLSISDYSQLDELTDSLLSWTDEKKISLSLPSLRANSFTKELMDKISTVRTGGITFAPEAGTQRLRDVINKDIDEETLLKACKVAFSAGKNSVKLYFMQGHPTETDEDIEGIAELAEQVVSAFYATPDRNKARPVQVTLSVACFIPKPFTPFQWEAQDRMEESARKQDLLSGKIRNRKIRYHYHSAEVSRIEGVFARGNRKLSAALLEAHKQGLKFDAWEEFFSYDKWLAVFEDVGLDPAFYANRAYGEDEVLPWDIIDIGVSKSFLLAERHKAYEGKVSPRCNEQCLACGAHKLKGGRYCCTKTNTASSLKKQDD